MLKANKCGQSPGVASTHQPGTLHECSSSYCYIVEPHNYYLSLMTCYGKLEELHVGGLHRRGPKSDLVTLLDCRSAKYQLPGSDRIRETTVMLSSSQFPCITV